MPGAERIGDETVLLPPLRSWEVKSFADASPPRRGLSSRREMKASTNNATTTEGGEQQREHTGLRTRDEHCSAIDVYRELHCPLPFYREVIR